MAHRRGGGERRRRGRARAVDRRRHRPARPFRGEPRRKSCGKAGREQARDDEAATSSRTAARENARRRPERKRRGRRRRGRSLRDPRAAATRSAPSATRRARRRARPLVMYRPGFAAEAHRLARDTGISIVTALDGLQPSSLRRAQLVVVLGTLLGSAGTVPERGLSMKASGPRTAAGDRPLRGQSLVTEVGSVGAVGGPAGVGSGSSSGAGHGTTLRSWIRSGPSSLRTESAAAAGSSAKFLSTGEADVEQILATATELGRPSRRERGPRLRLRRRPAHPRPRAPVRRGRRRRRLRAHARARPAAQRRHAERHLHQRRAPARRPLSTSSSPTSSSSTCRAGLSRAST